MKTFRALPAALASYVQQPRWALWRQGSSKNGRLTKVPYQGRRPSEHASSKDPATWSDFPTALGAYEAGNGDGIVLCLLGSDLTALDLDHCRNATTGEIEPAARDLIKRAKTYVEITPSGEGLRIIGKGSGTKVHRKQEVPGANGGMSVEAYRDCERFITVTGDALPEATTELADNDALIEQVVKDLDAAKKKQAKAKRTKGKGQRKKKLDLDDIIKNGEDGHFSGDRSRAVWFVIHGLLKLGKSADEVVAILIDPANGISAHCLDQPNPEQHARRQVDKAQKERADDPDVEIERLAKLSTVEYEQQRKEAAERLDVRTSILDRLVAAERKELGLDADDGKQGHAVTFSEPEPWPEEVNGAELLDGLAEAIHKHVVMADHFRDTSALWSVHAYLIDCFLVSPRLCVRSPTHRCGKTTLLDVLGRLVWRAQPAANLTASVVFRVIEAYRPTLLVDEADAFLRDNDELRGVLNSGHRKGGTVLRGVGDDHEPRAFSTYSACVIALIGALPGTLHDRSVVIDLKRRMQSEKIEPFRPDRADHLDVLARKAARWAKDHSAAIANADPDMPPGVINREADNWRPLLAIADEAGGEWPKRARKAAEAAHTIGEDRLEQLLIDIRAISKGKIAIPSVDLVKALVAIEGRPWGEMGKSRKPMTQNGLARMLKPLGITPENVRVGEKVLKGYVFKHFDEAFARYLPQEGASEPLHRHNTDETGTSEPFQTATSGDDVADEKCEKPNNDGHRSGIADEKGGSGEKTYVWHAGQSDDLPYTGPAVEVPDLGPDPLDEHGVPRGTKAPPLPLTPGRARDLRAWSLDWATARRAANLDFTTAQLEAELRIILREELPPNEVEAAIKQVVDLVFKS